MKKNKMIELINTLNQASEAYYNGNEIMDNFEYDALWDELVSLEKEIGIILENSPTQKVGREVSNNSKLKKIEHKTPALSLDKTKSIEDLKNWLGDKKGVLSWKMDGLTGVATYKNGKLKSLVTRGNGYIGEDITHNAKYIDGLPLEVDYEGDLEIRGELVMTYSEFNRINETLEEKYKNPRNLAAGTLRALDDSIKNRKITFYAFQLVSVGAYEYEDLYGNRCLSSLTYFKSFNSRLDYISKLNINTVEHCLITPKNDLEYIIKNIFECRIKDNDFPTDGLVLEYDDVAYGESLGSTGHHPKYGLAFKWADEEVTTTLRDIEWSASRTGLLNPVAIFDEVEIEGTSVSRASLHNLSYIIDKDLRIGNSINCFKANLIIPQISKNLDYEEPECKDYYYYPDNFEKMKARYSVPEICPVCHSNKIMIQMGGDGVLTVKCDNKYCAAKKIGKFERFVERDAMNIEGLSSETLSKFIDKGYISEYCDIYNFIYDNRDELIKMDGFGEKSIDNLDKAIEKSRTTTLDRFIYALGIPNIGKSQAKLLKKEILKFKSENEREDFDLTDYLLLMVYDDYDFTSIDGFGEVIDKSIKDYFWSIAFDSMASIENPFFDLVNNIIFEKEEISKNSSLDGKIFVITGSLAHFKNRDELIEKIESLGGKVSGSVSSKTSYLINNDKESTSGKNKKAKELNIKIISEEEFLNIIQ